jgi:hypothetical protein
MLNDMDSRGIIFPNNNKIYSSIISAVCNTFIAKWSQQCSKANPFRGYQNRAFIQPNGKLLPLCSMTENSAKQQK